MSSLVGWKGKKKKNHAITVSPALRRRQEKEPSLQKTIKSLKKDFDFGCGRGLTTATMMMTMTMFGFIKVFKSALGRR